MKNEVPLNKSSSPRRRRQNTNNRSPDNLKRGGSHYVPAYSPRRYNRCCSPNVKRGGANDRESKVQETDDYFIVNPNAAGGPNRNPNADGLRAHNFVLVDGTPVPEMVERLEEIKTQVRRDGRDYEAEEKMLKQLINSERIHSSSTPDGGDKLRSKIVEQKHLVGILAHNLHQEIASLVKHLVMMKLDEVGLLDAPAKRRWLHISCTPTNAHGIVGRNGQGIAAEIAELNTARVNVIELFEKYLSKYPNLQAHLLLRNTS